jgi:hypothetical protein
VFWLVAPTLIARYSFDSNIHEKVDRMWAIHENRVKKGLGGTYQQSGIYNQKVHMQDSTFQINNGLTIRKDEIVMGIRPKNFIDNPFLRWNQNIDDNPHFHSDWDDHSLYETDNFERMKKF